MEFARSIFSSISRHLFTSQFEYWPLTISIIIPTYQEAEYISKTIRHLIRHGGPQVTEILVVDGHSDDFTANLAEEAGAVVFQSPSRGRAAQMDFGARQAKGDLFYFVHADTLPPISFARDIHNLIADGFDMGNFRYQFEDGPWMLKLNSYFTQFSWFFTQGGDRTFFITRKAYEQVGGFDPEHLIMEEYEFLRRAIAKGLRYKMVAKSGLVSSRKYRHNSWLKVQLVNLLVYFFWARGWASGITLKNWYQRWLRP